MPHIEPDRRHSEVCSHALVPLTAQERAELDELAELMGKPRTQVIRVAVREVLAMARAKEEAAEVVASAA